MQLDIGYTYDDNATRGRVAEEILTDQLLGFNASAASALHINDNTRVQVTALLNGEKFRSRCLALRCSPGCGM